MVRGITAYQAYVPVHRLGREDIASFLGRPVQAGSRPVAGHDEDSSTLAVEALRGLPVAGSSGPLWFASTSPAYLEKSNSSLIHAAVGMDPSRPAYDMVGSLRSGVGALRAALDSGGIAVMADIRMGLPESSDESMGADAAASIAFGSDDVIAEVLGVESITLELLDRWRFPESATVEAWDERYAPEVILPLWQEVMSRLGAATGIAQPDHVAISCANARLAATVAGRLGVGMSPTLRQFGFAGAAHVGVALADVLDRAQPGETILVLGLNDGVDAVMLRATDLVTQRRAPRSVADLLAGGKRVGYGDVLTWRGMLTRQPPRRPDPQAPASPPSYRERAYKLRLAGARCTSCGWVMLPVQRVCLQCGAKDQHETVEFASTPGTIATLTADRLTYSLAPPMLMAVIDFDGGGRQLLEVTDADEREVHIGTRVEPTFRRVATSEGIHNYFWKVRPLRSDRGE